MSEFLAAIPLSLLLVFSTGPVFFVIVETSITKGARRAFCVDIGAVIADIVFILIATFSAQPLRNSLEENPRWYIIGGVLLCSLGLVSLLSSLKTKQTKSYQVEALSKGNYLFYIAKGFFLNIINIGVFLFWVGLVVFGAKLWSFVYILLIYLLLDIAKIYLAKQLKTVLTPLIIHKIKLLINIIIFGFGLFFVFQGSFPEQKEQLKAIIEAQIK
jgi:threonine/homoserine/homoserine lactone efflux protein